MSVGQFDTLGVLIIALMSMGQLPVKRKSGVAEWFWSNLFRSVFIFRQMGGLLHLSVAVIFCRNACVLVLYGNLVRLDSFWRIFGVFFHMACGLLMLL